MSWQIEMVTVLRALIGDLDGTPKYCDSRLEDLLLVGALQASGECSLARHYDVNVMTRSISPDPSAASTRDTDAINMFCLKAACIFSHGDAMVAAKRAMLIRDGSTTVDRTKQASAALDLLEKGYCAVYERAKMELAMGQSTNAGQAVVGPIRTYYSV